MISIGYIILKYIFNTPRSKHTNRRNEIFYDYVYLCFSETIQLTIKFVLEYMSINIGLPRHKRFQDSKNSKNLKQNHVKWKQRYDIKRNKYNRRRYSIINILIGIFSCLQGFPLLNMISRFKYQRTIDPYVYMATEQPLIFAHHSTNHEYDSILCNAISDAEASKSNMSRFDSDSFPIKIDNCCTKTIS
jgi:hypothetical protein